MPKKNTSPRRVLWTPIDQSKCRVAESTRVWPSRITMLTAVARTIQTAAMRMPTSLPTTHGRSSAPRALSSPTISAPTALPARYSAPIAAEHQHRPGAVLILERRVQQIVQGRLVGGRDLLVVGRHDPVRGARPRQQPDRGDQRQQQRHRRDERVVGELARQARGAVALGAQDQIPGLVPGCAASGRVPARSRPRAGSGAGTTSGSMRGVVLIGAVAGPALCPIDRPPMSPYRRCAPANWMRSVRYRDITAPRRPI